jgi:hypothetical protein
MGTEESNKHFITAQTFAKPTISEDTERFSCSFNVGQQDIITGQLGTTFRESAVVRDLSDDLWEIWDTTYSAIDYPLPKMFGGMPIDSKLNQQIPFEILDERPRIKALVVLFEEIFPYLSFYKKEEKVMVFRNGNRTTNLVQGKLQRQLQSLWRPSTIQHHSLQGS